MKSFFFKLCLIIQVLLLSCGNNSFGSKVSLKPEAKTQTKVSSTPIDLSCKALDGDWVIGRFGNSDKIADPIGQVIKIDAYCSYRFRLEVNSCFGGFEIMENDSIHFYNYTCTEMCCDSDFSHYQVGLLTSMQKVESMTQDTIVFSADLPYSVSANGLSIDSIGGYTRIALIRVKE